MTIEVEGPDGSIVEFPDGTADDVINNVMRQTFGGPEQPSEPVKTTAKTERLSPLDQAKAERDAYYSSGIYAGDYNPLGAIARSIDAGASAAQSSPLFGWGDEAVAGLRSLAGNTDYATAQAQEDARKQAMRQQNPIASIAGDIGGGLVTARAIPSLSAGRSVPFLGRTVPAAAEAATYGAVTGAGEASPGERGTGALIGGAVGGATGALATKVADALASRAARNTANAAAPTALELKDTSQALYRAADQSGVGVAQPAADRLLQNLELSAGRLNEKLRPRTAGIVEDINSLKGKPMDLQTFHELRQQIDKAAKGADATDEMYLTRMRDLINNFADNAQPNQLTGPKQGMEMFREADSLWRKRAKTQKIEDLFDLADVQSETYSQSGMANAIRLKSKELYTQIVKGKEKSFNKEEVELIRKLAKGEMSPRVLKLAAKFAPRGVVSIGSGLGVGAAAGSLLGPVGTALGAVVPAAIGQGAGTLVDRAAANGLRSLQTATATGNAPVLRALSQNVNPLLQPIGSVAASQAVRSR